LKILENIYKNKKMNFLTILSIFLIVSFQLSPLVLADASLFDFVNFKDFETTTHATINSQKSTTHATINSQKSTTHATINSQKSTTHATINSQKSTTHASTNSRKTSTRASTNSQRTTSKLSVSTTPPNNSYDYSFEFGKRDLVENVQHVFRNLVREMKVFVHKINFLEKEFERIYQKEFENRTTGHVNATTGPNLTKHFNTTDLRNLMFNKRNLVSKKLGQVKKITKQTTEQTTEQTKEQTTEQTKEQTTEGPKGDLYCPYCGK
jgi:hypothetical protein